MSLYTDLASDVTDILTELGQSGTVTRAATSGGGPADPDGETVTETAYAARMVVFPISPDRIDGTNVLAGDFQCICEAISIEIEPGDVVTCTERSKMKIVSLGKIAPAGVTVAYDMVIR